MKYRIDPHHRVRHDLNAIRALLADYAGDAVARRIVNGIVHRIAALGDMPHVGTIRDASGLRVVPHGKAAIVIRVDDTRRVVRVLGVTYGGADWGRRVRRRR